MLSLLNNELLKMVASSTQDNQATLKLLYLEVFVT